MARAKAKKKPAAKTRRKAAKQAKRPVARKAATKRGARKAAPKGAGSAAMRALAQRIVELTLSGDDEGTLALYAEGIESSEAGGEPGVGLDALRAKFAGWRSMTTNNVFEPRRVAVDGNLIAIEWIGRVTIAATGRQVEMREVALHEIKNGKIVREVFYYNPAVLGLG